MFRSGKRAGRKVEKLLVATKLQLLMKLKGSCPQFHNPAKNNPGGGGGQVICLPLQCCICEEVGSCLECNFEERGLAAFNSNSAAGTIAALHKRTPVCLLPVRNSWPVLGLLHMSEPVSSSSVLLIFMQHLSENSAI